MVSLRYVHSQSIDPHANRTTYRLPECLKGEEGQALSQHIISLAMRGYDVYVGVCPRVAPEGPGRKLGKEAIEQVGAVWVDLDSKVPGASCEVFLIPATLSYLLVTVGTATRY